MTSYSAALLWLLSTLAIIFSSCSSTRFATVPEYHESVAHQRDSFSLRDSIFVYDSVLVVFRGDTVLKQEFHTVYRDRCRNVVRIDSFIERDTVTVIVEVEKPKTAGILTKMRFLTVLLWLLAAVAVCLVVRILYKRLDRWKK